MKKNRLIVLFIFSSFVFFSGLGWAQPKSGEPERVIIDLNALGEKMGVPMGDVTFPDGGKVKMQQWGKAHISKVIADLQYCFDAPENTMESFKLAWERGARFVETDVHLSREGEVVLIHDENTLRTTGYDGAVAELSLEELRSLDAGSWKSKKYKNARIPTLEDLLKSRPEHGKIVIELRPMD